MNAARPTSLSLRDARAQAVALILPDDQGRDLDWVCRRFEWTRDVCWIALADACRLGLARRQWDDTYRRTARATAEAA